MALAWPSSLFHTAVDFIVRNFRGLEGLSTNDSRSAELFSEKNRPIKCREIVARVCLMTGQILDFAG
jgi:hypothetical protein